MAALIIGAPKFSELPVFLPVERAELYRGCDEKMKEGSPLEIQMAIPLGALARIAVTLLAFESVLNQLSEPLPEGQSAEDTLKALRATASAAIEGKIRLSSPKPAEEQTPESGPLPSRLVIPQ